MEIMLLKCFFTGFGIMVGALLFGLFLEWFDVIIINKEKSKKEGYDEAIEDFLTLGVYWDRTAQVYKKVSVKEIKE